MSDLWQKIRSDRYCPTDLALYNFCLLGRFFGGWRDQLVKTSLKLWIDKREYD